MGISINGRVHMGYGTYAEIVGRLATVSRDDPALAALTSPAYEVDRDWVELDAPTCAAVAAGLRRIEARLAWPPDGWLARRYGEIVAELERVAALGVPHTFCAS